MIIASPASQKRIPTIVGLILVVALLIGVGFTTQAVQKITKIFSQAESVAAPTTVDVANISPTSVTIYWVTDKDTSGAVFYGKSTSLGDGVAIDDRDHSSASGKYSTHFVRLNNLKPETKYYFKIGVGSSTFGNPTKGDSPYEVSTPATSSATAIIDPIFGKVNNQTNDPTGGILAIWQSQVKGKIASLSTSDGNYVLPIGTTAPTDGASETITLDAGGGNPVATITCKIGQDRPLPTIKLGEALDCSKKTATTNNPGGFKAPSSSLTSSASAGTLVVNVNSGQTFNTALPTISGKAGPSQIVQIVIHSDTPYSGTVQADPSGNWSWTPPANLSAGQHTVTITVVNADGTTKSETRTFTVQSGSPILPITSGTPSAELTHLSCVGSACSVVGGVGPNTCARDSDCATTILPTPTPTPPPPPPSSAPPQTGSLENTLLLLTMGLIFATLGIGMFLKH